MKNILCYGDSNTFGLSPDWVYGRFGRHAPDVRWTGRLALLLGEQYHIIEEGLNGRTTVFDDPTIEGRNGLTHLPVALESHMPLDCVVIMLGTNDTKPIFSASPIDIAAGLGRLIQCVLAPFRYSVGGVPKVLVASPVPMKPGKLNPAEGNGGAIEKSRQLASAFEPVAKMFGCDFIDLALVTEASDEDGVHLNVEAHKAIAEAIADKLKEMLE
ncbi:MAG: SGNH/GDSL hydrolase family protein [Oscillospiraceae bacterium]|nr:SGNH/GDSL hydrolase family protein [Oscillospiraceae bacterium]